MRGGDSTEAAKARNVVRMLRPLSASLALVALLSAPAAFAGTRILSNEGGPAVLVGTMDWPESTEPILTVMPRGLEHGLNETRDSIAAKLKRGTFAATFLLGCLAALEMEGIRLEDI